MAQVSDLADDHPLPPASGSDIAPPKKAGASPKPTPAAAALARAREHYAKAGVALTRARDRADDLLRHPHALRAREIAETQLDALRKVLLKSDTVKDTVELTKLDPAVIVFGTVTLCVAVERVYRRHLAHTQLPRVHLVRPLQARVPCYHGRHLCPPGIPCHPCP